MTQKSHSQWLKLQRHLKRSLRVCSFKASITSSLTMLLKTFFSHLLFFLFSVLVLHFITLIPSGTYRTVHKLSREGRGKKAISPWSTLLLELYLYSTSSKLSFPLYFSLSRTGSHSSLDKLLA